MKILLLAGALLTVSLVLAQEPPGPPEPPEPTGPPEKHPLKQCQDKWNICVGEEEGGFQCLPNYYKCLNEYTKKCRELYKNEGCYKAKGKDKCWQELEVCYGKTPEKE